MSRLPVPLVPDGVVRAIEMACTHILLRPTEPLVKDRSLNSCYRLAAFAGMESALTALPCDTPTRPSGDWHEKRHYVMIPAERRNVLA